MKGSFWKYLAGAVLITVTIVLLIGVFVCDNYSRLGFVVEILSTFVLGVVPLYILQCNRDDDKAKEDNRMRNDDLERVKVIIDQNFSTLDFVTVGSALRIMQFDQEQALNILFALLRQVENQGHRYDLNLPYSNDEDCVRNYTLTFGECLEEYGHCINDMILACHIQRMIASNMCNRTTVIKDFVSLEKQLEISSEAGKILFSQGGLVDKLKAIPDDENYVESVRSAIAERINEISKMHMMKNKLAEAGRILVEKKRGELVK